MAFRDLSDADIEKIAEAADILPLAAGQELAISGGSDTAWHLLISGRVRLFEVFGAPNRQDPGRLIRMGDFFGADQVLYGRIARWKVKAMAPSKLLVVPASKMAEFIPKMPVFKQGLLNTLEFEALERARDFSWLTEDEQVKLFVRQHPMFLIIATARPLMMALGSLLVILVGARMPVASFGWAFIWIGIVLLALALLWLAWQVIDWANDHYVVTDKRVVWLERILVLYDSRREALLSAIKSTEVKTSYWGRVFGFGDFIVYALMGQVRFANIANPETVKALVDQLQRTAAMGVEQEAIETMERIIRRKIDPPPPEPAGPVKPEAPQPQPARRRLNLVSPENFFRFALREEKNNIISYRQHTIILLYRIWLPTLIEIGLLVGALYIIARNLAGFETFPTLPTTILAWLLFSALIGLWWAYQYMDWRDDLYQIAPDKLISSNRRPFGEEQITTAPLGNILSMDYQRVGIIGLLFNFGNLEINTGSESKLVFQNILNPSQAQMEISNYLFAMRRKQRQGEQARDLEQISNYIAAYHRQVGDMQRGQEKEQKNP